MILHLPSAHKRTSTPVLRCQPPPLPLLLANLLSAPIPLIEFLSKIQNRQAKPHAHFRHFCIKNSTTVQNILSWRKWAWFSSHYEQIFIHLSTFIQQAVSIVWKSISYYSSCNWRACQHRSMRTISGRSTAKTDFRTVLWLACSKTTNVSYG